jgi:hypothetical protein
MLALTSRASFSEYVAMVGGWVGKVKGYRWLASLKCRSRTPDTVIKVIISERIKQVDFKYKD